MNDGPEQPLLGGEEEHHPLSGESPLDSSQRGGRGWLTEQLRGGSGGGGAGVTPPIGSPHDHGHALPLPAGYHQPKQLSARGLRRNQSMPAGRAR